jgi:uncharacterized protein YdhG (YjbR/CyaY superfamily)
MDPPWAAELLGDRASSVGTGGDLGRHAGDRHQIMIRERRLTPARAASRLHPMATEEIDAYLSTLEEPKQTTLRQLRATILEIAPGAEQCVSYGMPAFRLRGKLIAGFAAFKNHLSYLPHSGSVFPELAEELAGYEKSTGSLRFPVDQPLPPELVEKLVTVRLRQAFPDMPRGRSATKGGKPVSKGR